MRKVTDIIRKKLVVFALIMASVFVGVASPMAVSMTNVEEAKATEMFPVDFRTILGSDMGWIEEKDPSILNNLEIKLYKLDIERYREIIDENLGGFFNLTRGTIYNQAISEAQLVDKWSLSESNHITNLSGGDYFLSAHDSLYGLNEPYPYFTITDDGKEMYSYEIEGSKDDDITSTTIYKEGSVGTSREIKVNITHADLLVKYIDPLINIYDSSGNNITDKCEIAFYKKDNMDYKKDNMELNLTTGTYVSIFHDRYDRDEYGGCSKTAALEHPGTHIIRCVNVPPGYKKFDDVTLEIRNQKYVDDGSDMGWPIIEIDDKCKSYAKWALEPNIWYNHIDPAIINITLDTLEDAVMADSVQLNKSTLTLDEGKSETLTATVLPEDTYDKTVTWSSSDNSIAIVDNNGKVTGVKAGSTEITAETVNGKTATCEVTVKGEETGNLKLIFEIPNLGGKEYKFRIAVGDSVLYKNKITGKYGDIVFNNGIGEFTYKDKKTLKIEDLPVGLTYSITNNDLNINEQGIVEKNKTTEVRLKKVFDYNRDWWASKNHGMEGLKNFFPPFYLAHQLVKAIEAKYGLKLSYLDRANLVYHINKGDLGGQCYGMSLLAILNYIGFTDIDLDHDLDSLVNNDSDTPQGNHDDVTEEILFWHSTQWLNRVKDKEKEYTDGKPNSRYDALYKIKNNVPTLLSYTVKDGVGVYGNHTVFAYDYLGNSGHKGTISVADPNYSKNLTKKRNNNPTGDEDIIYDEDNGVLEVKYFNNWTEINNYQGISNLIFISDIDTLTLKDNYQGDFSYAYYKSDSDAYLKNINNGTQYSINMANGTVDGNPTLNVSYDSHYNGGKNNALNIELEQKNDAYSITSKNGERYSFDEYISYKDAFLCVEAENALGADFDPNGTVILRDNDGTFDITLAKNNIPTGEFNTFYVSGTAENSGDITVSMTDRGIKVEGDNIKGITIMAMEDDITDSKTIEVNKAVEYGRKSEELVVFFDDIDVNTFTTSLSETKYVYDGQSHVPEIKVTHNDKVLVEGTDYKVTLPEDTVNVGKKEIIVEGINDYSGTFKLEYEIVDGNQITPTSTDANASSNTNVNTVSKPNATSSGGTATKAVASTGTVTSASKTGDNNLTGLWITLSAVSAGILGAIIVAIKKRRTE